MPCMPRKTGRSKGGKLGQRNGDPRRHLRLRRRNLRRPKLAEQNIIKDEAGRCIPNSANGYRRIHEENLAASYASCTPKGCSGWGLRWLRRRRRAGLSGRLRLALSEGNTLLDSDGA